MNLKSYFQNSKRQIQYGGRNLKKFNMTLKTFKISEQTGIVELLITDLVSNFQNKDYESMQGMKIWKILPTEYLSLIFT